MLWMRGRSLVSVKVDFGERAVQRVAMRAELYGGLALVALVVRNTWPVQEALHPRNGVRSDLGGARMCELQPFGGSLS